MFEKRFSIALSLAKILVETRERFTEALREAAIAKMEPGSPARADAIRSAVPRHTLEPLVDDALYALVRDGAEHLEDNVHSAIDEIMRAAFDVLRRGGQTNH